MVAPWLMMMRFLGFCFGLLDSAEAALMLRRVHERSCHWIKADA
jgi:hypothetical protein